jgi:oligopeptide/dipeptide ABC transporter ATP-binding protein
VALLEVTDLHTQFKTREGEVRAVDGVSLTVEEGKVLGIVGESGCGKSVTALSIMGLVQNPGRVVSGSVRFDGRELTGLKERELEDVRGRSIGMIFQDPMTSLNPVLTIGAQITETLRRHLNLSGDQAKKRAIELLEEVQIPDAARRLSDYPHRFSGGMRQRVMIAIALSCNPRLLIADEPTTALDVTVQAGVLDLLDELRVQHNMTMMMISHNMGVVAETADDILVMYAGQIVERGPIEQVLSAPLHPYTRLLLAAVPDPATKLHAERIEMRKGIASAAVDPPEGCRFVTRCPLAIDVCSRVTPPLVEAQPQQAARCHVTAPPT